MPSQTNLVDLDLIGGIMGTDKSSADHNYLVHYDRLFREFRSQHFNFLEIGIFRGASLATWREYFSAATIIGVDIQESCRQYAREGIVVEIGSQEDPGFLIDLIRRYPAKIIIDDGSHQAHHVLFTFETLFPSLEPGGLYVIEDLHFHAGAMREHARGHSEINPIDYFTALARMIVSNEVEDHKNWGFTNYTLRTIDEIVFFGHGAAIRKKAPRTGQQQRIEAAMQFAEKAGTPEAWERTAKYLAGNHAAESAVIALKRGIAIEPSARLYLLLSGLHATQGDQAAASAAARTAVEQAHDGVERGDCLEHLGNFLVADRRFDEAVRAFEEAVTLVTHPVVVDRIADKIRQYKGA